MKEKLKKNISIESIGIPKISALSKEDLKTFITTLEFEIIEYLKDKSQNMTKQGKKPP